MGRVFGGFAIGFLILAAAGISGTVRVDHKVSAFAVLSEVYIATSDISVSLADAERAITDDPPAAIAGLEEVDLRIERLVEFTGLYNDIELAPLSQATARLAGFKTRALDAKEQLQQSASNSISQDRVRAELQALSSDTQALRDQTLEGLYDLSSDGISEVQRLIGILSIMGFVAIILVVFGKRAITRRIAIPIERISSASESIAAGETDVVLPYKSREDEIGILANALAVLRDVQFKAVASAERELEQEKTIVLEREQQREQQTRLMHELAEKFEATIGDVAKEIGYASAALNDAAGNLSSNVERSSGQVDAASKNLSDATHGMTNAAAATDEFALSIAEVSSQAATSSQRARKAADAASSADQTIGALTDSADQISQIVEVIATIAQRTNLLALNASIEAARSAESGRGFAVVANEVKELAAQTHRETSRVEALINTMQNATGQSASALSTIAMEVIELESAAGAIASAVDQQAYAGQDLARAIERAAQNTRQVNQSFSDLSALTSSTNATAAQLRDSSDKLNQQSIRLRDHVSEFLRQVRAA
ncbi:methyl-accepting chemotaxis protein [Altererythrobacter lutimaris]|uniref:HAMP domain-containing protein n=1 Tax=Altererythrobacter lutimaris TaxID=2743979 RepID=A0A850H6E3_9SPHN|nr:HAMP domain-containing methyl-accepting chemotaxis protein [Altererythrobacter lutimaris]NVE94814.1 HAMP domain-containing protein [Altererythrobacter lutimaris]